MVLDLDLSLEFVEIEIRLVANNHAFECVQLAWTLDDLEAVWNSFELKFEIHAEGSINLQELEKRTPYLKVGLAIEIGSGHMTSSVIGRTVHEQNVTWKRAVRFNFNYVAAL